MKAIFPDSKLLQPLPTPNVHPNISGNTNNNPTATSPSITPTQNTLNIPSTPTNVALNNIKSENNIILYFTIVIILIIVIAYKKLKQK